jgi:hypothetical protein
MFESFDSVLALSSIAGKVKRDATVNSATPQLTSG